MEEKNTKKKIDIDSFKNEHWPAREEISRILSAPGLDKVKPLLIMANKQDQPNAMKAQEVRADELLGFNTFSTDD